MTAADPARVRNLWIQPGDLLIERSNTPELVGTACLYRGPSNLAVYPDLIIRARVNGRILPEYAELVLKSPFARRYFQKSAQGISGSMPKIDQQAIANFRLQLPTLDDQREAVREAERKLSLIASLEESLKLTTRCGSALHASILSAAYGGRLVAQDPADQPASVLLQCIAAERSSTNSQGAGRVPSPRAQREQVTV